MTDPTPPAAPRPCGCGHDAHPGDVCWEQDGAIRCQCQKSRPVSPEAAPPMTEDADATFLLNYAAALRHSAEAKRKLGFVFGPECVDVQAPIFERIAERLAPPSESVLARIIARNASLPAERRLISELEGRGLLREFAASRATLAPSRDSGALLDDPELDATDGAHPAWWRGNDRGVESACERLAEVLNGDSKPPYYFGSARLSELATRLSTLERDAARMREALIEMVAAALEVNNRYIGGAPLRGRLGDALERLATAHIRGRRALAALRSPTPEGPQE